MNKEQLYDVDNGRFRNILETLNIVPECFKCAYFNINLPRTMEHMYKCHVEGSCIAATLHPELQSYLLWKTGMISEKRHLKNLKIKKKKTNVTGTNI